MKYKILLLNLGYLSGLNGSFYDYIFKSYRYIFPSKRITRNIIKGLKQIISNQKPDIICIIEIRKNQIKELIDNKYNFYDFETKYIPKGLARRLPILKNQGNGFISKEKINFKKFFIKYGSKKLAYDLELPGGIKLILFHFALGKKTRIKQFAEIREITKNDKNLIICGDFNIFKGISEIEPLIENTNLKLAQKNPTFPAFNPKKILDLFVISRKIKAKSGIIKSKVSDHLPVALEIET